MVVTDGGCGVVYDMAGGGGWYGRWRVQRSRSQVSTTSVPASNRTRHSTVATMAARVWRCIDNDVDNDDNIFGYYQRARPSTEALLVAGMSLHLWTWLGPVLLFGVNMWHCMLCCSPMPSFMLISIFIISTSVLYLYHSIFLFSNPSTLTSLSNVAFGLATTPV